MALGQEKHAQQRKQSHTATSNNINPQSYFQIFKTCFVEINSFLEFMINTSAADYRSLPFSEWGMQSLAIIYFAKLCQFKIADIDESSTFKELVDTERAIWLTGIDRLCDRLEETSSTTTTTASQENTRSRRTPDFFYLFSTILKLFKENFVRESGMSQTSQEDEGSSCQRNTTSRSQCPVMNGDLQHTDYWDMLMNDSQYCLGDMECFGAEADLDINDPAYFDLTSWVDISL